MGAWYEMGEHTDQATGTVETLLPIALGKRNDLYLSALPRRMNKTTFAEVNTDMGKLQSAGIEKNQITRHQLRHRDFFSEARDFLRGTRQHHAGHLLEHVAHQSAAVESPLRSRAAEFVIDANQAQRVNRQVLRAVPDGRGSHRGLQCGCAR